MKDCGGEFADGGVAQRDFHGLMENHIAAWSANAESYKIKQPVQNIGLQVEKCWQFIKIKEIVSEAYIAP